MEDVPEEEWVCARCEPSKQGEMWLKCNETAWENMRVGSRVKVQWSAKKVYLAKIDNMGDGMSDEKCLIVFEGPCASMGPQRIDKSAVITVDASTINMTRK